jgi:hypothetical protein
MSPTPTPASTPSSAPLGSTLVALLRGVVDRTEDARLWHAVVELQAPIRDHLAVIGLDLVVVDDDGYAFLRQRPPQDDAHEAPRLMPRRPLTHPVSMVLVALRKRMSENDAGGGDQRLIVSRDEIGDMVRVFLPDTAAETRFRSRIDTYLGQVERLGFIRALKGRDGEYEVRRILRSFIDAQWLQDYSDRLEKLAGQAPTEEV